MSVRSMLGLPTAHFKDHVKATLNLFEPSLIYHVQNFFFEIYMLFTKIDLKRSSFQALQRPNRNKFSTHKCFIFHSIYAMGLRYFRTLLYAVPAGEFSVGKHSLSELQNSLLYVTPKHTVFQCLTITLQTIMMSILTVSDGHF